jgi:hypothetical protein
MGTSLFLHFVGVFLAITGLLLGGCLDSGSNPAQDPTGANTETDGPTNPPSSNDLTPPIASIPTQIAWNECQGLEAALPHYNALVDVDDGETPPGWEPEADQDGRHYFMLNRCERVSIGPFERGPVSFLVEGHNRVNPPTPCREFNAGFESFNVLLSFWIDDPEVGTFLRETYGLPIRIGRFSSQVTPLPEGELHQWTWSSDGDESTLAVKRPGMGDDLSPYLIRYVWHNETGVSLLDLHEDAVVPYTSTIAEGMLAPPMKYAQGSMRPYTGFSPTWNHADHYGPIFRFGDMACKELLA